MSDTVNEIPCSVAWLPAARHCVDTLSSVPPRSRRSRVTIGALVSVPALLLGGCTVSPPPAPQSTETTETTTAPPPQATQIIMGIDSIGPGFNPHLLSDQSPVNAAISALVLPSSFRPVDDPNTPTGSRWEMDPTLLVSAEVTNQNPFTVTYKIRPEAQWTDNAPIGADDYWYMWRQMVSQPGVVDPAGYDLITGVQSVEGGKQAVVTFSQPYPAWRELFNNILPAHIVKDVPGGFAAGLARAMPVSGGQFRVDNSTAARRDPARPQRPVLECARHSRPAALSPCWRDGRAGRLHPQRRHPGGSGARRRGGVRAAVRDPRCADRADRHPARDAADVARAAAQTGGFPSAQGDSGPARRRPAGLGGRR